MGVTTTTTAAAAAAAATAEHGRHLLPEAHPSAPGDDDDDDDDAAASSSATAFMRATTDGSEEDGDKGGDADRGRGPVDRRLALGAAEAEVYELREGVGRRRKKACGLGLDDSAASYRDDHAGDDDDDDDVEDGHEDEEEEEEEEEVSVVYTADEERAVVRKFDRRLVLFVAALYLLSFLDRSNIGNAYTAGMDADLLRGTDRKLAAATTRGGRASPYEWALSAFYVAYIAFEWLALLWGVVPAHVYVAALVASWGVVASLQAMAGSYPILIALRFVLGIGEAGFAGIPIFLSFFFKREELALRTAVFISAAPLAAAFASSLAWVILKVGERSPIAPWRLLFLVEGFPAVIVATIAWRVIPDSPDRASYLTAREKEIAKQRLLLTLPRSSSLHHSGNKSTEDEVLFDSEDGADAQLLAPLRPLLARFGAAARAVLGDPIAWTTAAMLFLTNVAYASLPVFLPTILAQMGHTSLASQALAAPPHLLAFCAVLLAAAASDALRARGVLIAAAALVSAAGYAFLALARRLSDGGARGGGELEMARYAAVFPAAGGFFCVVVLTIAWNVNNANPRRKGGAFALMQVVGQCGPLLGTRLYPAAEGPWFERGMGVCAAAMCGVAVLALGLRWKLARENRRLDAERVGGDSDEARGLVGGRRKAGLGVGGDGLRYML